MRNCTNLSGILEIRRFIEQQKGARNQIQTQIHDTKIRIKELKRDLKRHEEAREVLRIVGLETQRKLQYHISDITSLALEAVYDNPYKLVAEFVQRRNKTECDLYFERNGQRTDPLDASGGGVVNIASFALRIASWSMQRPRKNNVILLDEPLNNVSTDLLPRASEMLKQISTRLGLQMLIVTHSEELIDAADKVFRATIKNGITTVTEE